MEHTHLILIFIRSIIGERLSDLKIQVSDDFNFKTTTANDILSSWRNCFSKDGNDKIMKSKLSQMIKFTKTHLY